MKSTFIYFPGGTKFYYCNKNEPVIKKYTIGNEEQEKRKNI